MIKKVAMALARNELTDLGRKAFDANPKEYYLKSFAAQERTHYEAIARIAIATMREPTEEMIKVGGKEILYDIDANMAGSNKAAQSSFKAMIDAALDNVINIVSLK